MDMYHMYQPNVSAAAAGVGGGKQRRVKTCGKNLISIYCRPASLPVYLLLLYCLSCLMCLAVLLVGNMGTFLISDHIVIWSNCFDELTTWKNCLSCLRRCLRRRKTRPFLPFDRGRRSRIFSTIESSVSAGGEGSI